MFRFRPAVSTILALTCAILAAGCQDAAEDVLIPAETVDPVGNEVRYVDGLKLVVIDGQEYVAADQHIPRDVVLPAMIEPYDPLKHGPLLENTIPEANLMLRPDFEPPSKDRHMPGEMRDDPKPAGGPTPHALCPPVNPPPNCTPPPPPPPQAERGVAWWRLPDREYRTEIAMRAYPDVDPGFPLPTGGYPNVEIFPSTNLPPGYACIEMTAIHVPAGDFHGFFNHCAADPDWLVLEDMSSSSWQDRYAGCCFADGEMHVLTAEIRRLPPDCWVGVLYNRVAQGWEIKTPTICGETNRPYGWSGWESWNYMELMDGVSDCPEVHSVYNFIVVDGDITFDRLEKQEVNHGICFTSGYYDIREVTGINFHWVAETPNPK